MTRIAVTTFFSLLCSGVLAGHEVGLRYGVSAPLASLEDDPHIRLRQALILRLRVMVPVLLLLTFVSGVVTVFFGPVGGPRLLREASLGSLILFLGVALGGTVPINQAVLTWDPGAPPAGWQGQIRRWERLDTARVALALLAFSLLLAALIP